MLLSASFFTVLRNLYRPRCPQRRLALHLALSFSFFSAVLEFINLKASFVSEKSFHHAPFVPLPTFTTLSVTKSPYGGCFLLNFGTNSVFLLFEVWQGIPILFRLVCARYQLKKSSFFSLFCRYLTAPAAQLIRLLITLCNLCKS